MSMSVPLPGRVHVIGANGRSGAALCRALVAMGVEPVAVVRRPEAWRALGIAGAARVARIEDRAALAAALADAGAIASCAHARHAGAILAAAPAEARLVLLGSTRRFSRWRDAHGDGVCAGEAALLGSGRPAVMLHPTMIYGASGEDNVQRLAALLRRLPLVPLPGGGCHLVQPIHQDDVTRAVLAALSRRWPAPEALVVAGPEPLPYCSFVRAVAAAAGLRAPRIVAVPAWALIAASPLTVLPGLPRIRAAEIRRLLEDKAFPVGPMRAALGFAPIPLEQGLARSFPARG